ncbi:unnamed protein product [Brassicogethes aeneus]|uniref:Uncharacterized protein n=1 Tax=Brassicogethes aeneus TaxID=1431903 RepID=A0A9P0FP16_BRAAE|nr:unnamed protein product [Brassicogethes aeneus]
MATKFYPNFMILFIALLHIGINLALKCYICGGNADITCDNFDPSNTTFIKECNKNLKSCNRKTIGMSVKRTCEKLKLNDCQTANNVEYCYCTKDLCNGDKLLETTDDEDILEGSGVDTNSINNVIATMKPKTSQASIKEISYIFYITIIYVNSIVYIYM